MVLKHGQKYDSFYDKIKDYHVRKLQLERNAVKMQGAGEYSKEYNTLTKAKKDIKDKIKENIEAALIFSEIVRAGEVSVSSREHDKRFQYLFHDRDLGKYELTTGTKPEIREEISDEAREFTRDVFSEEMIDRLLDAIFFEGYKNTEIDEKHRNYIINVAKKMVAKAIYKLMYNLDSQYSEFLSQDLNRAIGICNAVGKKPDKTKQIVSLNNRLLRRR